MKVGLITGIAGTVTVTFAGCAGGSSVDEKKPNIIFIIADDLGYNDLGCYGQKIIETPNIDALAANGIRFTNYYSGSPVSAPSRCVLLTGKHTGILHPRKS
jgi:arylsulfatase